MTSYSMCMKPICVIVRCFIKFWDCGMYERAIDTGYPTYVCNKFVPPCLAVVVILLLLWFVWRRMFPNPPI